MRAAVIGYGKSGKAAEKLLKLEGYEIIDIYDDKAEGGKPVADFRDEYDCVAVSPGINLRKMANAPEKYTSEIELAYKRVPECSKIIAITGTNGKSTVTTLTAQLVEQCGLTAIACGNIGLTFGDAVLGEEKDVYVAELSSFQTGMLKEFRADAVVMTNLAEDHMDRYTDLDDYAADKVNLLNFLKPDGRLIIEEDDYLRGKASVYKGEIVEVSKNVSEGKLDFGKFYVETAEFPLEGGHNLINLSFALLAIESFMELKGDVSEMLKGLKGLEHRCEFVAEIDGVEYINDSKGTNIHSTLTALNGMDKGIVIILGGKDKNGDFTVLKDVLNQKCSGVIAYGHAGEKIYNTLKDLLSIPFYRAENLKEAVNKGHEAAKEGEKVLLSPACASFDEHRSFEHRGTHFKELVMEIKGN